MEQVIIFHEKHGNRIFDGSTEELVRDAMLSIVKERSDDGFWYEDTEADVVRAQQVVDMIKYDIDRAFVLAKVLLNNRQFHEYEGFDLYSVETPTPLEEK